MVRYELQQNNITVAYGHDELTGLFLSVYDKRLIWDEKNTDEANKICDKISEDGGGSYLKLHTGEVGFGYKVDKETIIIFMKKYDVKKEHLLELSKY
ncbi:hypothetical protein K492DRAFT_139302 [Lichtheimia hyalospora FSU 10163]|nr:hypothetical protein K492DRAFT_139302 [Lichtheimia hyalospora FSU 10163]